MAVCLIGVKLKAAPPLPLYYPIIIGIFEIY